MNLLSVQTSYSFEKKNCQVSRPMWKLLLININTFVSDQPVIHRPFLSNHELAYIHHQPFSSPMRTSSRPWCRPVFTQLQRRGLEKRFQVTKYVTKRERLQIGAMLGLSETQVKVWFQNRRTKWRHEAARKEEKLKEKSLKKVEESQQEEEEERTIESDETEEITGECSSEVSVKELW